MRCRSVIRRGAAAAARPLPGLLAIGLALALNFPAAAQPAATAPAAKLEPEAMQALERMGAYLRTLQRFSVKSSATADVVDEDGQKLQFSATTTYLVTLPDKIAIEFIGNAGTRRQVLYDGKRMALIGHPQRKYVTWPQTGTVAEVLESADADYGIELPLRELFLWGAPGSSVQKPTAGYKVGEAMIAGEMLDHYAFRQPGVDYQIWLAQGDKPLPRKLVITNLEAKGQPQFVSHIDWTMNPATVNSDFRFVPPADYTLVDFGTARLASEAEGDKK